MAPNILPPFNLDLYIEDMIVAVPTAFLIGFTILATRKIDNPWLNRKLIHLSTVPAILLYLYVFKEPYAFFTYGVLITLMLLVHHLRKKELSWFQLKGNLGEVYFALSYTLISILLWNLRALAVTVMLLMAVGDALTGIVRMRFCEKRCKHWIGSIAMFVISSIIGYALLGIIGIIIAVVAALAEKQQYVDDNISIPLTAIITYFALNHMYVF